MGCLLWTLGLFLKEVYIRTYVSANRPPVIRTYISANRLHAIRTYTVTPAKHNCVYYCVLLCSTNRTLVLVYNIVQWCALMCYNLLISAEKVRCFVCNSQKRVELNVCKICRECFGIQ